MQKILIKNQEEMANFAKKMADDKVARIIGLKGTLGVGKSFFAKHFINQLLPEKKEILSPTFNIVYSYLGKKDEIFHFDLYRLKNADELENIGFFDAIKNNICLIEWPEIAENYLQKIKDYQVVEIAFDETKEEQARIIMV